MLALADAAVVEAPQLGPLRLGLPLAELVAQREDALLGACLLLVAPCAAEDRVELVLQDRVQQGRRLQAVARRVARLFLDAAVVDRLLDRGDDQPLAELLDAAIAEVENLGEVVAGVDVHDREREARRPERLLGESKKNDGVLPAREEQHGPLELGRDLAHDEDRLGLQGVEMGKLRSRAAIDAGVDFR